MLANSRSKHQCFQRIGAAGVLPFDRGEFADHR
jgi:hypothetical protein